MKKIELPENTDVISIVSGVIKEIREKWGIEGNSKEYDQDSIEWYFAEINSDGPESEVLANAISIALDEGIYLENIANFLGENAQRLLDKAGVDKVFNVFSNTQPGDNFADNEEIDEKVDALADDIFDPEEIIQSGSCKKIEALPDNIENEYFPTYFPGSSTVLYTSNEGIKGKDFYLQEGDNIWIREYLVEEDSSDFAILEPNPNIYEVLNLQKYLHAKMPVLEIVFQGIALCVLVKALPGMFNDNTEEKAVENYETLQATEEAASEVVQDIDLTGSTQGDNNAI